MCQVQDNHHDTVDAHQQTNPRITVWCAIHGNTLLKPAFLKVGQNTEYLQLSNVSVPYANELPLPICEFYFQQAGQPAHFVRNWTDEVLPGQWIGCRDKLHGHKDFQLLYPYIFLSGFIWHHFYSIPGHVSFCDLKENIHAANTEITLKTLKCVCCSVQQCINLCKQQEGCRNEHLLR